MSLSVDELSGVQTPARELVPEAVWSEADDAAFLASSYGLTPDPWQFHVLEGWLGRDAAGLFTAGTCWLGVPRQNGKNGVIELRELFGMVVLGEKFLHTAHEVKTARKAFLRLCHFFENPDYPELVRLVREIRRTNGQEAIVLHAKYCCALGLGGSCNCKGEGGSVEFVARSKSSARGFTVDVLVLDEAQELTDEQYEAQKPTISAAPLGNPQTIFTGTPPEKASQGEVFTRLRRRVLGGGSRRICFHSWETARPKGDLTLEHIQDWERIRRANPGLGIRVLVPAVEDELESMSIDGFARERLGMWMSDKTRSKVVIAPKVWAGLATDSPPIDGRLAVGVRFPPGLGVVAVGVALKPEAGATHVELVHHEPVVNGFDWLVDWLVERSGRVSSLVVDGRELADVFINQLVKAKFPERLVVKPSVSDVIAAHPTFLLRVNEGLLTHFDQIELNNAVGSACKRDIGKQGGWAWGSVDETDVSPLSAVTLALFGVETTKRRPDRKTKVVVF